MTTTTDNINSTAIFTADIGIDEVAIYTSDIDIDEVAILLLISVLLK